MSLLRRIFLLDALSNIINPATEDKQDATITALTDGTQRAKLLDEGGNIVGVQHPLSTDGDSVYAKDINVASSSVGTFSGVITDLFDSLTSTITDSTAANPKALTIVLNRPIDTGVFRLCTGVNNFSNVKFTLKDRAGNVVSTIDDSANNTKYTSQEYATTPVPFCTVLLQFYTADTISLDWLAIDKVRHSHSLLQALKPDGTITYIDATAGGNLKVSLEELESGISVNSNTQLRVTPFDSSGNEPGLILHDAVYGRAVTQRTVESFSASLSIQNLAASADYILIDLSDTTNFPHTDTGHIHWDGFLVSINPSVAFVGDIIFGYLKNVDATDGDFVHVRTIHIELQSDNVHGDTIFFPVGIGMSDSYHLGAMTANDTAFQTDVALTSPAGTSVAGSGDMAMRVVMSAGNVDISATILYHTEA